MKKNLRRLLIAGCSVLLLYALFVICIPMTVSLTFDDGLKVHRTIAAPLVEAHGWRATFNVPTDYMDPANFPLTQTKAADFHVKGLASEFMIWDEARQLVTAGHEVNSHTRNHSDLEALARTGDWNEIRHQVKESTAAIRAHLGTEPKYLCLPHNNCSQDIQDVIRECGVEPFNWRRMQFGGHPNIRKYLLLRKWIGIKHVDLMMHGITKASGGFCPFDDEKAFAEFLDSIQELEKSGLVKVVPYSVAHADDGSCRYWPQKVLYWIYDVTQKGNLAKGR